MNWQEWQDKVKGFFLNDIKKHEMTIVKDDGVNRYIRFRQKNGLFCWFDIVTWPGYLCIAGNCGSYVFQRTNDMFDFFWYRQRFKY